MNIPNNRPLTPFGNPLGFGSTRDGQFVMVSLVFDTRKQINMPLPPPMAIGLAGQIIGNAVDAAWSFGWEAAKSLACPECLLKMARREREIAEKAAGVQNGQSAPAAHAGPAPIEDIESAETRPAPVESTSDLPETKPALPVDETPSEPETKPEGKAT